MIGWTWSIFYDHLLEQRQQLASSMLDEYGSSSELSEVGTSSSKSLEYYYVNVKNPNFGLGDVVRHLYEDKVGDLSRTANIGAGVNLALAPITPYMLAAGPPGIAARAALSIGGTIAIASYANTADSYRDLVNIVRNKEVGGTRLYGHSVRSR